jgi:feruloyl esterase
MFVPALSLLPFVAYSHPVLGAPSIHGTTLTARTTSGADACSSFALAESSVASVTATQFFAEGDTVSISNLFSSINSTHLPAFCRKYLYIRHCRYCFEVIRLIAHLHLGVQLLIVTNPSTGKTANAEVWLPEDWNGRFLAVGNGGFGGGGTLLVIFSWWA